MPLQKQNYVLKIQGLDLDTQEKSTVPGKLLVAENVDFTEPGAIKKRTGYSVLQRDVVSGVAITDGKSLHSLDDSLVLCTNDSMYSYVSALDEWQDVGPYCPYEVTFVNKYTTNGDVGRFNISQTNGYQMVAMDLEMGDPSLDQYYLVANIYDTATKALINTKKIKSGASPASLVCMYVGNNLIVCYGTGNGKKALSYDTTTHTWGSEQDLNNAGEFVADWAPYDSNFSVVLHCNGFMYYMKSDGSEATVGDGAPANINEFTDIVETLADEYSMMKIAKSDSSTDLFICYNFTYFDSEWKTDLAVTRLQNDLATSVYGADLRSYHNYDIKSHRSELVVRDDESAEVYYSQLDQADEYTIQRTKLDSSGSVTENGSVISGALIASKPIPVSDSETVLHICRDNTETVSGTAVSVADNWLVRHDGYVLSSWNLGVGGMNAETYAFSPGHVATDNGYLFLSKYRDYFNNNTDAPYTSTILGIDVNTNSTKTGVSVTAGKSLVVTGSRLWSFGGKYSTEINLEQKPQFYDISTESTSGSIADGTYLYKAIYEWRNAQGEVLRSPPSDPITLTNTEGTGTARALISIESPHLTNIKLNDDLYDDIRTVIYRTTDGGSIYYRTVESVLDTDLTYDTLYDTSSDSDISSNEMLYTTGGELINTPAPIAKTILEYNGRLWCNSAFRNDEIRYTKPSVYGEASAFNSNLLHAIDGEITALSVAGSYLLAFTEKSIWGVAGDGADATGANSSLQEPVLLSPNTGCINPLSVARSDIGVLFQSKRGINVLGPDLQAQSISAGVADYEQDMILSSIIDPTDEVVRFTQSDRCLVYDYKVGRWSIDTISGVDATVVDDTYYFVTASGLVYQSDDDVYTDNGNRYSMKLKTGWVSLAGIAGYKRVYEVFIHGECDRTAEHTLSVKIYYDDSTTVSETKTYTVSSGSTDRYEFRFKPSKQKCSSIQFEIEDTAGNAFEIHDITFRLGMKTGTRRISSS